MVCAFQPARARSLAVIPAKAGIQAPDCQLNDGFPLSREYSCLIGAPLDMKMLLPPVIILWIPAYAGMTVRLPAIGFSEE